jgi:hypothetical protein
LLQALLIVSMFAGMPRMPAALPAVCVTAAVVLQVCTAGSSSTLCAQTNAPQAGALKGNCLRLRCVLHHGK